MTVPQANGAASPHRLLPIAVVAIAVLAVSHGAIFARMAAAPALAIAAWRLSIAAAFVALIVPWHWRSLRASMTRSAGLATVGASLCLALHFATWISSLNYTSVSNSVILVNTSPIWVALFGWLSRADRPAPRTLLAIALAVAGAAIIGLASGRDTHAGALGDLLALAGGAAMGGYLLFARVARLQLPLVPYLFCCYSAAAVVLWMVALGSGAAMNGYDAATWLALLGIAVIPQLIGHSGYNWSLRFLHPSTVSVTLLGEGVIGSALAFIYFGEAVPGATWVGGPLVLVAIWLATTAERSARAQDRRR
ncbi:MAG TPA: DMT family transporter [Steroidobacteraceae bacterium]|nr:DMT family transporter [Steroidobacteraceae bacterium]